MPAAENTCLLVKQQSKTECVPENYSPALHFLFRLQKNIVQRAKSSAFDDITHARGKLAFLSWTSIAIMPITNFSSTQNWREMLLYLMHMLYYGFLFRWFYAAAAKFDASLVPLKYKFYFVSFFLHLQRCIFYV